MKLFLFSLLAWSVFAAGPIPPPARADIQFNLQRHMFSIRALKSESQRVFGAVGLTFTTDGFPRWRLTAMKASPTAPVMTQFRAAMMSLIEFVPTNASLGYQRGDRIVAEYGAFRQVGSPRWSNMVLANTTDPVSGAKAWSVETNFTPATMSNWLMQIVGTIADMPVVNSTRRRLDPSSLKFDINIQNFPYAASETQSQLCLKFAVDFQGSFTMRRNATSNPAEGEVEMSTSRFAWAKTVTADGVEKPVLFSAELLDDDGDHPSFDDRDPAETRKMVYFTMPAGHPTKLEWDPTVGTVPDATSGAAGLAPSLALLAFLLAMLLFL